MSLYSKYVLKSILMSMTSLNKHRTKLIILGSKSKKPIREGSRLKSKILIRPLKGEPDQRSDTELKLSLNMLNPNHTCEEYWKLQILGKELLKSMWQKPYPPRSFSNWNHTDPTKEKMTKFIMMMRCWFIMKELTVTWTLLKRMNLST